MPPQYMWPFEEELELWFERVDREREARYGGGSSSYDDDETGSMMGNELARGRGRD